MANILVSFLFVDENVNNFIVIVLVFQHIFYLVVISFSSEKKRLLTKTMTKKFSSTKLTLGGTRRNWQARIATLRATKE